MAIAVALGQQQQEHPHLTWKARQSRGSTASAMSVAAISRYTSVLDSKQILRRQHYSLEGGLRQMYQYVKLPGGGIAISGALFFCWPFITESAISPSRSLTTKWRVLIVEIQNQSLLAASAKEFAAARHGNGQFQKQEALSTAAVACPQ